MINYIVYIAIGVIVLLALFIWWLNMFIKKKKRNAVKIPEEIIKELENIEKRWSEDLNNGSNNPYATTWKIARTNKRGTGTGVSEDIPAIGSDGERPEAVSPGELHREPTDGENIQSGTPDVNQQEHTGDKQPGNNSVKDFIKRIRGN